MKPSYGVRAYDDDGNLQCHICGRYFKGLGPHVVQAHGYESSTHYKRDFGLGYRGLISDTTRAKMQRNAELNDLVAAGEKYRPNTNERAIAAPISAEGRAARGYETRKQQTHCRHGHELTPENTRLKTKDGRTFRSCRTCENTRRRLRRAAQRETT